MPNIYQVLRNTHTYSSKVLPTYLFYFPASTAKTPNIFVVVGLDIPVLNIDALGVSLWELCLQLVGEVMENAHTVLCGLRKPDVNISHLPIDTTSQVRYRRTYRALGLTRFTGWRRVCSGSGVSGGADRLRLGQEWLWAQCWELEAEFLKTSESLSRSILKSVFRTILYFRCVT